MTVRDDLLRIRCEIDELLERLPVEPRKVEETPRYMKIPDFAKLRGYSSRTIRDYCDMGMPCSGSGHGRRVHVAEAIAWIVAGGAAHARMSRRGAA